MSDYEAITTYLFGLQRFGIKLGLDNIEALLNAIGNPQNKWQSIHIAGTNGKGSTAAMLESILMQAGYKVGLYTSPHLVDFTERIRINRTTIPQNEVIEFTLKIKPLVEQVQPSFFEVATAMAFWYFAKEKIDLAILETGLGGRLDSTNIVNPLITAITPIDFDHQKYLGNSIEKIAKEKAGVIKPGVPCVTNNRNKRICEVIKNKCADLGANYINIFDVCFLQFNSSNLEGISFDFRYSNFSLKNLILNLCGEYQVDNAALALGTVLNLKNKINITEKNIYDGLKDVLWRGRIDLVSRKPNIVIDVSHNSSGFEKTLSFINQFFPKDKINVITFLQEDKDSEKIGELLSNHSKNVFITDLRLGKPANPSLLYNSVNNKGGYAEFLTSFRDAMEKIHKEKRQDVLWLIIGSHYLAGEAYRHLQLA